MSLLAIACLVRLLVTSLVREIIYINLTETVLWLLTTSVFFMFLDHFTPWIFHLNIKNIQYQKEYLFLFKLIKDQIKCLKKLINTWS